LLHSFDTLTSRGCHHVLLVDAEPVMVLTRSEIASVVSKIRQTSTVVTRRLRRPNSTWMGFVFTRLRWGN